jgi:hypothetical protein
MQNKVLGFMPEDHILIGRGKWETNHRKDFLNTY